MTLAPGRHLRHVLERETSRGAQIGCTLAVALLVGGIGGAILVFASRSGERSLLIQFVGAMFVLVGALALYSGVHQLFALKTPQTIVETDSGVFKRGGRVRLYFRQPGPGSFESLRANLVGEESWSSGPPKRRRKNVVQLGVFNLFDSGPFEVDAATPFERTVEVEIPDVPHASSPAHAESWQLEVWGKVRGRADFQHVFPVRLE